MIHKETNSIETLINEDRNFCAVPKLSQVHEISSWNIENSFLASKNSPNKHLVSSLPPISLQTKTKTTSHQTINQSVALGKAEVARKQENSENIINTPNRANRLNKPKINEFKSLEDIVIKFTETPNRGLLRLPMKPPRLRPRKTNSQIEDQLYSNQSVISYTHNRKLNIFSKRKDTNTKDGYPFQVNTFERGAGSLIAQQTLKFGAAAKKIFKVIGGSKDLEEFLVKLNSPMRSRSMFSDHFIEQVTTRNKYLLSPIVR